MLIMLLLGCIQPDPSQDFLRMRASTAGEEVVFYWSGTIRALEPQKKISGEPILWLEGYNIARAVRDEEGAWKLLTREVSVYKNSKGEILSCWPSEKGPVPVIPMVNDPVNFEIGSPEPELVDDKAFWSIEIPLSYPSPLTIAEHPEHSAGDLYQSVEIFDFIANISDLKSNKASIPAQLTWSRVGPWLPWMNKGQEPGWLVYHVTGRKLMGGFSELPQELKDWVRENEPTLEHAPETDEGPNQTSWSKFKDLKGSGGIPSCQ